MKVKLIMDIRSLGGDIIKKETVLDVVEMNQQGLEPGVVYVYFNFETLKLFQHEYVVFKELEKDILKIVKTNVVKYFDELEIPKTKKKEIRVPLINGMNIDFLVSEIENISKEHNVDKKDICIGVLDDDFYAFYFVDVELTDLEINRFINKVTSNNVFDIVVRNMQDLGYVYLNKPKGPAAIYDLLQVKNYDNIVNYYAGYFDFQTV